MSELRRCAAIFDAYDAEARQLLQHLQVCAILVAAVGSATDAEVRQAHQYFKVGNVFVQVSRALTTSVQSPYTPVPLSSTVMNAPYVRMPTQMWPFLRFP